MQYYEVDHFVSNQDALIVLGDQDFREVLGDNIPIIPKDILDDVLSNCVFLMLSEKEGMSAGFIPKKFTEGKNIFAFYEILYSKGRDKQVHMILHEIAHYVLGHTNEGLSDEDFYNHEQEKEANRLVAKWIDDWEKHLKTQEEKNKGKGGV
jgi:hypothetical protein